MRHVSFTLAIVSVMAVLVGCDDTSGATSRVELRDDCDPATFNAALGAGTCLHATGSSGMTLAAFNAELNATGEVAAWEIAPASFSIEEGETLPVVNVGGETHTFTEVENFGGGVVPALNQASGNTTVAPECANQAEFSSSTVLSGQTVQHTFEESGTERYQCCIHPWMRQTVTVH